MGSALSTIAPEGSDGNCVTHVILNVYDLTPLNNYMYWFGLGIFHSGIEVHGLEYGFGAHDFPTSGVFEVEPRRCPGFIYRCSIPLGMINMPPPEFRSFMETLAAEYHGDTYHLIGKNCNHFTDDVCYRLTGRKIPGWVNRLAGLGLVLTMAGICLQPTPHLLGALCSCLLPESLQLTAVKQMPEYHMYSGGHIAENFNFFSPPIYAEDGSESLSITTPQPTESDDADHDKHLLSSPSSGGDVAFIKEVLR